MSAQQTIRYFSYYLLALGTCVLFAPGLTTAIIFMPAPTDGDYVFIGFLLVVLGFYYGQMARRRNLDFIRATVIGRIGVFAAAVIWVIAGGLAPNYLAIVFIDLLGALWTIQALRAEGVAAFKLS